MRPTALSLSGGTSPLHAAPTPSNHQHVAAAAPVCILPTLVDVIQVPLVQSRSLSPLLCIISFPIFVPFPFLI
ncbi:hypothetical protein BDA96_04G057700 [Sorghum bicolor]|uniref:Uncharacterized protein n=2 Tax=Sorghum bicolor TaxID=4558 RepID=A0A921UH16_SORBI|nr:hypothetical protein BDA96_04G057700 [Sorghum bicolor]KXG29546.1 hypothetical protein SORBI_3004G052600 [Sorghum bicolor]